jgi:hypothetical protein
MQHVILLSPNKGYSLDVATCEFIIDVRARLQDTSKGVNESSYYPWEEYRFYVAIQQTNHSKEAINRVNQYMKENHKGLVMLKIQPEKLEGDGEITNNDLARFAYHWDIVKLEKLL